MTWRWLTDISSDIWKPAQAGRGTTRALENPARRVVGVESTIEIDSYVEQHIKLVDFWCCSAYLGQLSDLVAALVEAAREGSAEILEAHVAAVDTTKQQLLETVGFRQGAQLQRRLRVGEGDERAYLCIFSLALGHRLPPAHRPGEYYGGRWQGE